MKNKAINHFLNEGYSCSESIILAAAEVGLCDKNLLAVASPFSAGISSGCLCGAIAGAQMVLGAMFGKQNQAGNDEIARTKAKEFIEKFKAKHNATCCRVLSAKFDFHSPERKQHCASMIETCIDILEELTKTTTIKR